MSVTYQDFGNLCIKGVDPRYRIKWSGYPTDYTWDGSGLLVTSDPDSIFGIHDVAHVMVCSPRRRGLPEFGLGPDPANVCSGAPCVVSEAYAQREETRVCTLHWCLVAYLGGLKDANAVGGYLGLHRLPAKRHVQTFAPAFPWLPEDFVPRVLDVCAQARRGEGL